MSERNGVGFRVPGVSSILASVAALFLTGGMIMAQEEEGPLFVSSALTDPGLFTSGIEGPACDAAGDLYAVNFERQGTIGRMTPDGETDLFVELPSGSVGNGIRFDSGGDMLIADYPQHNVLRVDMQTRQVSVFAHESTMNQPNDIAIAASDVLYASDPNWGKSTGQVWRIDVDGAVTLLEGDMGTTNGVEVGPGDSALYVNESAQRKVWAYDLSAAGQISNKRLLIEFPDFGMDGMRCDVDGNLYITRHEKGTVAKVSPEGELLVEIELAGKKPSNIAFGGPDGRTCYVTLQDHGNIETFRVDRPGRSWQLFQERSSAVAPSSWGGVKQKER